jgi:acyl dehydratase
MKSVTFTSSAEIKSKLGQEVAISEWVLVDQAKINAFADVTGDHQWIHIDTERAQKESPYGTTIGHGYLTLSLFPEFSQSCIRYEGVRQSINYGLNKVRFPSPVRVNSKVRAKFTLHQVDDIEGGIQMEWSVAVEIENQEKPACIANTLVRLYF